MIPYVIARCHACGHSLIAHGPTRGVSAKPERICWQCATDGPCAPAPK